MPGNPPAGAGNGLADRQFPLVQRPTGLQHQIGGKYFAQMAGKVLGEGGPKGTDEEKATETEG